MSDTSETYIKMCNHPKIQEQWKPKDGDWVYWPGNRASYVIAEDDYSIEEHAKGHTWLPTQDQIQEMMGINTVGDFKKAVFDIFFSCYGMSKERFTTPKQLLLAYYMYEKHDLTWDEDKWGKE